MSGMGRCRGEWLGRLAVCVVLGLASSRFSIAQENVAGTTGAVENAAPTMATDGADARGIDSPTQPAEPSERTFLSPLSSLNAPSEHFLGDWRGLRTRMEEQGLKPSITWVTNMAGNPTGGRSQGFTECDNLGIDFLYDLQQLRGIPDGQLHVSMSQRSGRNLSSDYIGNEFCTQQVFGGETFRLVNVEYNQSLLDKRADIAIGRIAAGDDFLTSSYYGLFMQNGIDGNPVAIFKNSPGMSGYPNSAWGARLRMLPTERTYAMVGVYNGDSSVRDNCNHGLDWSMHGPAFMISEAGYTCNGLPGDEGYLGHYKVGIYYDAEEFTQYSLASVLPSATADAATTVNGNYGCYVAADQVIHHFGAEKSGRGVGVFAAMLFAPDESTNKLPFFCTGGVAVRGPFARRENDTMGFAMVYGRYSNTLRAAEQLAHQYDPSVGVQTNELVYEWTYRIRYREDSAYIQPDFQYIVNPGGAHQYANAFVVGAQAGINF